MFSEGETFVIHRTLLIGAVVEQWRQVMHLVLVLVHVLPLLVALFEKEDGPYVLDPY